MNREQAAQLISTSKFPHYVYGLLRPNGQVFYIGKGSNDRLFAHEKDPSTQTIKQRIIKKIKREKGHVRYRIFQFCRDQKSAFYLERQLIRRYGKIKNGGVLSNVTDGGEGWRGGCHSEETKKRLSRKLLRMRKDPAYRKWRSKIASDLCSSEKHKAKIREGVLRYYAEHSEEAYKTKLRQKKAMRSIQVRAKMRQIAKEYYEREPNAKKKNSEALKRYYRETPGAIEKNRAVVKEAMNRPEIRRKMSLSMKRRIALLSPEEWSQLQIQRLSNPETRRRMSLSAEQRVIRRECKSCGAEYCKKSLNKWNKNFCDSCRQVDTKK